MLDDGLPGTVCRLEGVLVPEYVELTLDSLNLVLYTFDEHKYIVDGEGRFPDSVLYKEVELHGTTTRDDNGSDRIHPVAWNEINDRPEGRTHR